MAQRKPPVNIFKWFMLQLLIGVANIYYHLPTYKYFCSDIHSKRKKCKTSGFSTKCSRPDSFLPHPDLKGFLDVCWELSRGHHACYAYVVPLSRTPKPLRSFQCATQPHVYHGSPEVSKSHIIEHLFNKKMFSWEHTDKNQGGWEKYMGFFPPTFRTQFAYCIVKKTENL